MPEYDPRERVVQLPDDLAMQLLSLPITEALIHKLEVSTQALFNTDLHEFLGVIAHPLSSLIVSERFKDPLAIRKVVDALGTLAQYWELYTGKIATTERKLFELPGMTMLELEDGITITTRTITWLNRTDDSNYNYYISLSELSGDGDMWSNLERNKVRVHMSGDKRFDPIFKTVPLKNLGVPPFHAREACALRAKVIQRSLAGTLYKNLDRTILDLHEMSFHLQAMWQIAMENAG